MQKQKKILPKYLGKVVESAWILALRGNNKMKKYHTEFKPPAILRNQGIQAFLLRKFVPG